MPIKNLPLHLRPREKALEVGIEKLSDIELLALFLRSGTKNFDVLNLSKSLLEKFTSLYLISKASIQDIKQTKGIGKIKSLELSAIFEIAKRINQEQILSIKTNDQAAKIATQKIGSSSQEVFLIILLDKSQNLLFQKELFVGQEDMVQIEPKAIIQYALKYESKKFYCFHNHPSGDHRPSGADKLFTKRLKYYCDLFDIKLLGHIVVSEKGYSLIEE